MIKREAILQAILTLLNGIEFGVDDTPVPAFRSREEAFARDEVPAIVILPVQDVPNSPDMPVLDWSLTVRLGVYTRGSVPDSEAAEICKEIHAALSADLSLGGLCLDVLPGSVSFDFDSIDAQAGATLLSYVFKYRTSQLSLV